MGLVTAIVIIFGITALTFLRRDVVLYIIDCPLLLTFGLVLYSTFETPLMMVVSLALGCLGFYSLFKAIENLIASRRR